MGGRFPMYALHQKLPLANQRILVIEDEFMIAVDIAWALHKSGAQIVGPAATLSHAAELIRQDGFDMATVDVQLRDGEAYPLVDELNDARVPMVFVTGYERNLLRPAYQALPHVIKPFGHGQLVNALVALM